MSRLYYNQHPKDCSSARLFVWRSLNKKEVDNRGLGAMGTVAMWHLMHGAFNGYYTYVVINA